MTEQVVDLGSTWAVLRRRRRALVLAALLGAVAGAGLLVLSPPAYLSTSRVLLPSVTQADSGKTGGYDSETQVLIATSAEILLRAAQQMEPELTQAEITDRVSAEAPSSAVLNIKAAGPTAVQAEDLASAVAQSLIDYLQDTKHALTKAQQAALQERLDTLNASLANVNKEIKKVTARLDGGGRTSAAGRADAAALADLTAVRASTVLDIDALKKQLAGDDPTSGQVAAGASVIQPASPGKQSDLVTDALTYVLGGAAACALFIALCLLVTNQRDPKLRSRDEIADAVGIPVVTSMRVRPPHSTHAWRELLRAYIPDSPDAWALRQLLHGLVPDAGRESPTPQGFVLIVLAVSGDTAGLAVGPQIASFAASNGIATQLFAAQHHESATTLWAACSQHPERERMPAALSVTTVADSRARVDLTVRLVVLDRDTPEPDPDFVAGGTAVLAVSSGAATRRNLADAVVAADRVGLTVHGIVVANPDPLDRTTGRLSGVELVSPTIPRPILITARGGAGAEGEASASAPDGQQRRPIEGRKSR
jgi:capsular polysaccharide biosynthesis protein